MIFCSVSFGEQFTAVDQQGLFDQAPKTEFVKDQWYMTTGCQIIESDGSLSPSEQKSLNLLLEDRMGTTFLTIVINGELEFEGFVQYENHIVSTYGETNLIAFSDYSLIFSNPQDVTVCYMK